CAQSTATSLPPHGLSAWIERRSTASWAGSPASHSGSLRHKCGDLPQITHNPHDWVNYGDEGGKLLGRIGTGDAPRAGPYLRSVVRHSGLTARRFGIAIAG